MFPYQLTFGTNSSASDAFQTAMLCAEAMETVKGDNVKTPLFLSLCLKHALRDEIKSSSFILITLKDSLSL